VTQLELCNMALSKIGSEGGLISSLAESSKEAVLCNQFYTPALNEVLQLHPWKCAIKRAELKAVTHKSTSSDAVPSELQTTLYWYDSGLTNAGEKVYYDLSGTYAKWYDGTNWLITTVANVGASVTFEYEATDGTGENEPTPSLDGLRFYDTGEKTYYDEDPIFYDETGTYALWTGELCGILERVISPIEEVESETENYFGGSTASYEAVYTGQYNYSGKVTLSALSPNETGYVIDRFVSATENGDYTGYGDWSGTLTLAAEDPVFRWDYHFRIPSGCLRPLALFDTDEREENYQIEWDREGDWIMSDSEEVWLVYVGTPTVDEMDAAFQKVLYTNLAIKLAYPMTQDRVLVNTLHQEYEELVLPEARRMNSFIGHRFEFNDSEWLDTRTNMYRPFANMSYGTIGD
jgi:hypothetical protein